MKQRTSNIELLRIIAMMMIVIHHVMVQGIIQVVGTRCLPLWICDSLVIFGVNIFLLISGYFSIKFSWKKLFGLLWICCFYKIFHLCFRSFFLDESLTLFEWVSKPLGVLFSTGGWFMDKYLILFFIAPIINKALENMNRREYTIGATVLVFVNVVYGWGLGADFNPEGYSLCHFMFLYYLGYGINKYWINAPYVSSGQLKSELGIRKTGAVLLLNIIALVFLTVIMYRFDNGKVFSYNNPFVIAVSVCFLVLFVKIKPFVSTYVNFVATSMFPVYLIHVQGGFSNWFMTEVANSYQNSSVVSVLISITTLVAGLFVGAVLIDQLRKYLASYVVNTLCSIENNIEHLFCKR